MQEDRLRKQNQDAQMLQQAILNVVMQAQQLKAQGATDEDVQMQITPMIDEIIQNTFTSGTNQGTANQLNNISVPMGITQEGNMVRG